MPLHPCVDYYVPILEVLRLHPEGLSGTELTELVADRAALDAREREETITDGTPKYVVRIKQARYRLQSRKLVAMRSPERWVITADGLKVLDPGAVLQVYPLASSTPADALPVKESAAPRYAALPIGQDDQADAPIERVDRALREIQQEVEDELIQRLCQGSPTFFERAVLRLLDAMGYGKVEHTGGSGDGGIDGILRADRLGLERVYVQAKRWQPGDNVGAPELTNFLGALAQRRATKGVLITTASFSKPAEEQALTAPIALRLIDGRTLVALMTEFGVGVSRARVRVIPEVDRNFFDDA